jgi:hypothetical protein
MIICRGQGQLLLHVTKVASSRISGPHVAVYPRYLHRPVEPLSPLPRGPKPPTTVASTTLHLDPRSGVLPIAPCVFSAQVQSPCRIHRCFAIRSVHWAALTMFRLYVIVIQALRDVKTVVAEGNFVN